MFLLHISILDRTPDDTEPSSGVAVALYLIFRTNVLESTDLLFSHCRHDS